jgi:hypothetical protein
MWRLDGKRLSTLQWRWETALQLCRVHEGRFSDRFELRQAFVLGCALRRAVDFLSETIGGSTNGSNGERALAP